jgi:aspartyl-tRNA(Asn)/glutamyl-tRNA(Gln) amidotransferase subunit B
VADQTINLNTAKGVLGEMFATGRAAAEIVAEKGLAQVSDSGEIEKTVADVIAAHPEQLATYLSGKATIEQWFFGQAMKRLQGRGNPQVIRQTLSAYLEKIKLRQNS